MSPRFLKTFCERTSKRSKAGCRRCGTARLRRSAANGKTSLENASMTMLRRLGQKGGWTGCSPSGICSSIAVAESSWGQYLPKDAVLYGPDGGRVPRTKRVTHLPRDPHRSDIDVFRRSPHVLVLTEDAAQTLQGLLDSTKNLIENVAKDLTELWFWRRSNQEELLQPEAQWPNLATKESVEFAGYKPGAVRISPSAAMIMHPMQARRFHGFRLG